MSKMEKVQRECLGVTDPGTSHDDGTRHLLLQGSRLQLIHTAGAGRRARINKHGAEQVAVGHDTQ